MRIALDATYTVTPHPSGIAFYSQELLNGLTGAHPEDTFLFCYRPKQFRRAPRLQSPNSRRRLLLPPLPIGTADLFHALNQRVDRRPAPKVVSTFHDLFVMTGEYSTAEFRRRFTDQARTAAANSDMLLAVSEFTAGQIRDLLGVPASRIRVVPHGVHLPSGPVLDSYSREKTILFTGALQLRKNVVRLVRAFRVAPKSWRLVLAGASDGYQAAKIHEEIQASPARDRIDVRGYLSDMDLKRLYREAAIFAFPSLDEGFGMPVLEAMAHGVPVLTSHRSGTAEVARGAAILVDPFREEEIADGLLTLIRDVDLRHRLSAQGVERARLYSWDETCRATYAAYSEL